MDSYWDKKLEREYLGSKHATSESPFARTVSRLVLKQEKQKILELGCGLGQDSMFFANAGHDVVATDLTNQAAPQIARAKELKPQLSLSFQELNVTESQYSSFQQQEFDLIYAHLSLHYFTEQVMWKIVGRIRSLLKYDGHVALLLNPVTDREYGQGIKVEKDLFEIDGIQKRYFSVESILYFMKDSFDTVLCDARGSSVKDHEKKNGGLIRYIGKK